MLPILVAVVGLFSFCFLGIAFLAWVIKQATQAARFRRGESIHPVRNQSTEVAPSASVVEAPKIGRWRVLYKGSAGTETTIATGLTEAIALRDLVKSGKFGYHQVISSTEIS